MANKKISRISFLGIVFMAAMLCIAPSVNAAKKEAAHGEGGGEGEGKEGKSGGFITLDPIIVNLASDKGKRLLKVSIQFEPATQETAQEISNRQPQVIDALITVLSSKSSEGLLTMEGKIALKEQIMTKLNGILANGVKNVFFVEFIIQ